MTQVTAPQRRSAIRKPKQRSLTGDDFVSAADIYYNLDWTGILPLRGKALVPKGLTGWQGVDAPWPVIVEWPRQIRGCNIALRMPPGVIAIDVDHHDEKRGADTLDRYEKELGPLPPTWSNTSRAGTPSRQLFFRVPEHFIAQGNLGTPEDCVEILQAHHRYAAVHPSVHPQTGELWWWYDPEGRRKVWPCEPGQLPELPGAWLTALASGNAGPQMVATAEEADDLEITFDGGDMDAVVRATLTEALYALRGSRHPALTAYTLKLVRLGERGRTGVMTARSRLLRAFIKEAARDGSRDTEQASAEFDKAWSGALRIVAATPTADVADGVWPSPNEPRVVARRLHVECEQERPVRFWKERWTGWTGTRWKLFSPSEFREKVYSALEDAVYLHGSKNEVVRKPWNPDDGKVSKVVDAMKGVAWLGGDVDAPSWLDHRPDNPLGVIACANGLLRVTDGVLLPHTPQFFNLVAVPFDYDADAPQPKMWLRFLDEVFPRDPAAVTALQEWFGYIVSGRTDQHKMLMVIGPPRSGKGTITNVLEQLVGRENAASPSTDDLSKSGGFGLQALIGKSLATIADGRVSINGKKLVENLLRISGGDSVQIDVKYHEPWVGKLPTRLMFMSNEAPALPDNSAAVISRLIALEMTQSFLGREDVDLGRKLTMELPGILLWALDGLRSLDARGHFVQPESGGELAGMLSESASPMAQFVEERCVFGDKEVCSSSDLFSFWRHWCDENGHQAGSSTKMGRDLHAWLRSTGLSRSVQRKKRGPRGGQSWHYLGMGFANESSNATIDGGRVKTSRIKRRAGAR